MVIDKEFLKNSILPKCFTLTAGKKQMQQLFEEWPSYVDIQHKQKFLFRPSIPFFVKNIWILSRDPVLIIRILQCTTTWYTLADADYQPTSADPRDFA
jgi:hypothetical protein